MHSARLRTQQAPRLALGLLYYAGVRCPGCGSTHWNVGRSTAECGRCDTAMVIADARPTQTTLEGAN